MTGTPAPKHNPGGACEQCHDALGVGLVFAAAGTVYATGHEPDFCYGIDGLTMTDVVVHLLGHDGADIAIHPGETGNFYWKGPLSLPYLPKVASSKGERAATQPHDNGDCNLCHTDMAGGNGSQAPGRIVVPY